VHVRTHIGYQNFFMELLMKSKFKTLLFLFIVPALSACGGKMPPETQTEGALSTGRAQMQAAVLVRPQEGADLSSFYRSLDELAEIERAGSWFQGMALTESGIRENAGDYAGAVAAAYKEMAWAYGRGLIQKADIEQGLQGLLAMEGEEDVVAAANAILAFSGERWAQAAAGLETLFVESEEPDGFCSWMLLVCTLEKDKEDRRAGAAYKAIRARYVQFPEYWYRGARAFSGAVAAEYAENCINSSSQGPFADECRKILASFTGLKIEDSQSIRTKREIEAVISLSVNSGDPRILDSLLPLIGLPDNPYTIYAVGAMRALGSVPAFRSYFTGQAASSTGRLAERLSYICRG
jgi:hypothetical protein